MLGVYRDGRMQPDAWNDLAPYLKDTLGQTACALGYDEALHEHEPLLYAHIDDDTRQNGINRDLLKEQAARAEGDFVLVLQMTGKPPPAKPSAHPSGDIEQGTAAQSARPGGGMGGHSGMGGMGGGRPRASAPGSGTQAFSDSNNAFEVQAQIYSATDKDYVARVVLEYTGSSLEEALKAFGAKVHELVPGARCVGTQKAARLELHALDPHLRAVGGISSLSPRAA